MNIVIISVSSDIGLSLAEKWLADGHQVVGTYRTESDHLKRLKSNGLKAVPCFLEDSESIERCCEVLSQYGVWDCLMLCPGTMKPIGRFEDVDFNEWSRSIDVNFTAQLNVVNKMLPQKSSKKTSSVIFFAGGGTNSAPVNYSAYTVSKIALIKMCELLDSESEDCKFTILGPGWVRTKIHLETLDAGDASGDAYLRTVERLESEQWTEMRSIAECCEWICRSSKEIVSGRNFSVVHDSWGECALESKLQENPNLYKLRRAGNDI